MRRFVPAVYLFTCFLCAGIGISSEAVADEGPGDAEAIARRLFEKLDAPLLFVKRHSYTGIHIYDTFYKWPPGGGGIYVIENPSAARAEWKIRPIIDPTTPDTLGEGVYTHPELSWDGTKLLFCFKGEPTGSTSIFEIGVDGRGLRRLTDPTPSCNDYRGSLSGQHDVAPAYLPDGRIVFLSTRPSGLVPCFNTGVAILHVMNADGSDIHPISVNNVNEFDPCPLPDGRILFGRWEYVDKNALTIQSLWSANPDGTQETAVFANNMVFPEAILDARPVPNSRWIVGTFAKHNGTPRGSIAMIDPRRGKNNTEAIFNFEHPDQPTFDLGDSCEPWPISEDVVLLSGRPAGGQFNVLEMMDREGHRVVVHSDPEICLHSPMLLKPRPRPPAVSDTVDRQAHTGRFFVQDIYDGLPDVQRGEVKWLRVLEETSRTSERSDGPNPYNQTFLVSSALAFSVKNFLGVVPVEPDGSVYFEVPAGRAVYFQALDADGRLIHSMRTFVQASPGVTRSCIGCHEHKFKAARSVTNFPAILQRAPSQLEPESWGSGFVDYPGMVQPIFDRRCVRCHGGDEGIAGGLDLSGGWTEHFNIGYENLTNRCETQLTAHWISGIDCMNGTALWSAQIFRPRSHGSGAAPLAELLLSGHAGYIPDMTRSERDLILAWIDTNGLYYGTWNRTASGCAISGWSAMQAGLTAEMRKAGCLQCHGDAGQPLYFENDWVNLQRPELSRILRAPLAKDGDGHGLQWCRQRKVTRDRQRIHLLWNGYAHAVQPPDAFARHEIVRPDRNGEPAISFASTEDAHYQAMLSMIHDVRASTLANPRVDMPGARVLAGECRQFVLPTISGGPIQLYAEVDVDGAVQLSWPQSARTIGLHFELHRSNRAGFIPDEGTLLVTTPLFSHMDWEAPAGELYYALVSVSGSERGAATYAAVDVSLPSPPPPPAVVNAVSASGVIHVSWQPPTAALAGFRVERAAAGAERYELLTDQVVRESAFADLGVETGTQYAYRVRSVSRRGLEGEPSPTAEATARVVLPPVFTTPAQGALRGIVLDGPPLAGQISGAVQIRDGEIDLRQGGYATFPHDSCFELTQPMSVECWVWLDQLGEMPVIVSCGVWNQAGWFLQRLGNSWRWHVGGVDCDGGSPAAGRWVHLAGTFDGNRARLFQDGQLVAEQKGTFNTSRWPGELHVGQYSGAPGPPYQVIGRVKGIQIYHRPLRDEEVAKAASQ